MGGRGAAGLEFGRIGSVRGRFVVETRSKPGRFQVIKTGYVVEDMEVRWVHMRQFRIWIAEREEHGARGDRDFKGLFHQAHFRLAEQGDRSEAGGRG